MIFLDLNYSTHSLNEYMIAWLRLVMVLEKMKSGVIVAFEMMGEALEKCKFLKVMEALWTAVKVIAGGIADAVGTMMGTLAEKLGNADFSGVLDVLNSIAVGGIALSISKFLKKCNRTS